MPEGDDANTLLVVNLQSDQEQLQQIRAILRRFDIGVHVLPAEPDSSRAVVLRLPLDRLVEAVLALEYHGFSRIRAYPAGR